jgi:uncharacterized surface protein with fasciclin (FAS1) repeats
MPRKLALWFVLLIVGFLAGFILQYSRPLATVLQSAGLADTLKGKGPFTVFAPTDEAFSKLPGGTVESLLKPENKEKLKAILLYHAVSGDVTASQVVKMSSAKTLKWSMTPRL